MHHDRIETRQPWTSMHPSDLEHGSCLSCGTSSGDDPFCHHCLGRSRQAALSPEWDDLGVGD
jgi:hypothetical protein